MWKSDEDYDINDFYEFVPNPKDEKTEEKAVKIISGPFEGMIYKYGSFKFNKPEEGDEYPSVKIYV